MTFLPLLEIGGRSILGQGVPYSATIVQHLTLTLAFVGAMMAAGTGRLLALSTAEFLPKRFRLPAGIVSGGLGAAISVTLAWASFTYVRSEASQEFIAGVPMWTVLAIMPVGFAVIAWRLILRAAPTLSGRAAAAAVLVVPLIVWATGAQESGAVVMALIWLILLAAPLGLPIFAVMGGLALVLFAGSWVPIAAVPVETYRVAASPLLPAIPLFTLAGYIMAAGGASGRLVRVFTALFGWMPGGLAIVTVLLFAFFSAFTGASGVTILALGGLMLPVLLKARYAERFSIGLVTSAGSIGLLFPPSLPVILYGVAAQVSIKDMFLGGLLPGILLVLILASLGFLQGLAGGGGREPFRIRKALEMTWEAKWELALPALVIVGIFGGFATLVESAALAACYAFVSECFIHRELSFRRDIPRVLTQCATLVGGVLIILGVALGLTNYLVDAEIPDRLLSWVGSHVDSRIVFLLFLNIFLLAVGCVLDIFSAILVVVPLITPLGLHFGIDPIHLGIIFLANLELGYLTPPIGLNLFLAAYRFEKPLMRIYGWVIPFLLVLLFCVLLITYFPPLTLALPRLLAP